DNKIETVVVSDGQILDNSLSLCGKNKEDVYKILKSENTRLKDVFIMTLDALGKYNIVQKEENL
ncbi:MAG: YetF domain-containing protein, partial [Ruminococcus sp.]